MNYGGGQTPYISDLEGFARQRGWMTEAEVLTNRGEALTSSPKSTQVGGSHYRDCAVQPVDFIQKNGLGYIEGCCVKYLSRHKVKGGAEDIKKVIHYCQLLLEIEYGEKG